MSDSTPVSASVATVTCPSCGDAIPVSEALGHQMRERVREELRQKIDEQNERLAARAEELKQRESVLASQQRDAERVIAAQVEQRLEKLQEEAAVKARDAVGVELRDLQAQLKENKDQLSKAQSLELELRRRERELEDEKKTLALQVERRLGEERQRLEETLTQKFVEERRLKELEKDKQISDLRRHIEDLKRKAEQGSQQTQGEVLELELEDFLRSTYVHDVVEEVPKGFKGADVVHQVYSSAGAVCGTIVWESKRTKSWSDQWIEKLKEDQRQAKAEVAVIVSETLPPGAGRIGRRNGVWFCDFVSLPGLAEALRVQLIQVAAARRVSEGRGDKMEHLYTYISSTEFAHRVQAIVEGFVAMQDTLNKERRATERQWALREKQIQQVISNTAGMYGELQGLLGSSSLQSIPQLDSGESDSA